jgi:ABC-2 type transport system ATP-binding protein
MATAVQRDADAFGLTVRVGTVGLSPGETGGANDFAAAEQASRALAELAAAGIVVDDFSLGQPSLDEVFMALTDRPAVEKKEVAA